MNFIPYFWNEREGKKISSHLIKVRVNPTEYSDIVNATLNSSLFYWFFILFSNERDLTNREIEVFPLSIDKIDKSLQNEFSKITKELMNDHKKNANRKECAFCNYRKSQI